MDLRRLCRIFCSRFRRLMRGQGATEYLVILGAVLLVSIVIVSLLGVFPSSQVSMKQQQSQAYWSSLSPIKVLSSKVVDSNLVLQIQNTGQSTLRLDGVNVGGTDIPIYPYYAGDYYGQAYCSKPNDDFSATMTCALMIGAGESVYIAAQGAGVIDCGGKSGIEVSDLRFVYSVAGSSITNIVFKGDKPLITSCSVRTCDENWVKVLGNSSLLISDFCMMKYEAYKVSGTVTNGACTTGSEDSTTTAVAGSASAQAPLASINFCAAKKACLNAGKRLCTNPEWQQAALGTPDPGADGGATGCNVASSGTPATTGSHSACVSSSGAFDMIGNVWEWTDRVVSSDPTSFGSGYVNGFNYMTGMPTSVGSTNPAYGGDYYWDYNGGGSARAFLRGGGWDYGADAGAFALYLYSAPSTPGTNVGFRCCK